LTESTKTNEATKRVIRNMQNVLASNKDSITVYSNFPIEDNTITLENDARSLYFLLTSNRKDIKNHIIDFDINIDSDLNG
jgi:hypothetical protein